MARKAGTNDDRVAAFFEAAQALTWTEMNKVADLIALVLVEAHDVKVSENQIAPAIMDAAEAYAAESED